MEALIGEHVGIGTDYFVVVNCGQTWMKFDEDLYAKISIVYKRMVRFLHDRYEATSMNVNVSYETGSMNNNPHINITMDWEGKDAKAEDLYHQLSALMGDNGNRVRDMKIRQVFNERGVDAYISKENLVCVRDNFNYGSEIRGRR